MAKGRKPIEVPEGHTNLGFEPCEPGDIVKSRSKEDISTLNKNLKEGEEGGVKTKLSKKKKFKTNSDRIENDLFEEGSKSGKKKSRRKKIKEESDQDAIELAPLGQSKYAEEEEEEINVLIDKAIKKKKKSARSKPRSKSAGANEDEPTRTESQKSSLSQLQDEGEETITTEFRKSTRVNHVLGVFVHYADCLKLDFFVLHPVVKVSLVDLSTGKLIAKSDKRRKVTSYYEGDHVAHIVQLMTQPYDFKQKKSIIPRWEELLLFNEDPQYLSGFGANWGIFFEVVDFVRMSSVNNESWRNKDPHSTGWHHVAWAFLKPIPSKIHSNLGRRLRLQLYKPHPLKTKQTEVESEVWRWWSQCVHVPYPSSLYVTIEAVSPPEAMQQPSIRSMGALQPELGSSLIPGTSSQSMSDLRQNSGSAAGHGSPPRVVLWTRLPGQTCKIPDQNLYELSMVAKGAWCLRFSTDGKFLAVANPCPPKGSSVRIYSVETGTLESDLQGHKGPVYALDWQRSNRLLSASGDGTVRIWSAKHPRSEEATLHHPTYVYAARFHPNAADTIATGGYDQVVRIWQKCSPDRYIILHELVNHKSYVNCLEFDIDGQVLFSGDQEGAIRVWETNSPDFDGSWYLKKSLNFRELQGNAVLAICIHPGGRRLLVHCRSLSHPVIMVDLKQHSIMQTFIGSQSFKGHVSSCITPCGTFVISSSQDGAVYVWNADNGVQAHLYTSPLGELAAKAGAVVNCIHFSPTDHIIAFSGMVSSQGNAGVLQPLFTAPVIVYKHKVNSSSTLKRSQAVILPALEAPPNTTAKLESSPNSSSKEKFKLMLEQMDRIILDKQDEMSRSHKEL